MKCEQKKITKMNQQIKDKTSKGKKEQGRGESNLEQSSYYKVPVTKGNKGGNVSGLS